MNTKIIKFDLNRKLYEKIIAKQGDTKSRFLLFNLLDGSFPFDLTNRSVRVYGLKRDGTEIFNDLIINNATKGYCTLELTNQMLALSGEVELELMIIEGDKKLTSNIFTLEVRKSINSEKAIVSTNEFTALLNGLASLNEYDNYKNEIKDARGGQLKLKDRLDGFDESLEQKINLNEDIFYNEINIEKKRDEVSGTTYWVTSIPHLDKNGNIIKLKTGVSEYYETHPNRHEDDGTGTDYINNPKLETARNFSIRKKATLVINGGTWGNQGANGNCVVNGVIKASVSEQYKRMPLGIKTDNTLVAYDYTTTAQQNLDDGSIDVVPGFYPIMVNGSKYSGTLTFDWEKKEPRTFIGQRPNKEIIVIVCSGRRTGEGGMSMNDGFRLLSDYECTFGYNLDGGGSSSLVYRNEYLNEKIDFTRKVERKLYNFIYLSKEPPKSKLANDIFLNSVSIGDLRSIVSDCVIDIMNKIDFSPGYIRLKGSEGYNYQGIETWDGENRNAKLLLHKNYMKYVDYNTNSTAFQVDMKGNIATPKGKLGVFNSTPKTVTDLNILNESGIYWCGKDANGVPNPTSNGIIHFNINDNNKMQIGFPYTNDLVQYKAKIRRTNPSDGSWYDWKEF